MRDNMQSFPILNNELILKCFDAILSLYSNDLIKLLEAAQKATVNDHRPIVVLPSEIDKQIDVLKHRMLRTADRYGQSLLITWIEELYEELISSSGAIGVSISVFLNTIVIPMNDGSTVSFTSDKKWVWSCDIEAEPDKMDIILGLRCKNYPSKEIVKDYVFHYVQQAIHAYKLNKPAVAMSLLSISLEGTLRDALEIKGYSYTPGFPTEDAYEINDMHVSKLIDGYKVSFPSGMPQNHTDFLSAPDSASHEVVRIKRLLKNGKRYLEIRDADNLLDFWSSDRVATAGRIKIGGLGTAISIGRNQAGFLSAIDLPPDLDEVILAVRNNLIHLSGSAMNKFVAKDIYGNNISLDEFLKNKNRVFDAVYAIGNAVARIYEKIASSTL